MGLIDRKSSLETEPRTLNFRQIDIAREAALYVMHTRSTEEAYQIFTEGLERVETHMKPIKAKMWNHDFYSSSCRNNNMKRGGMVKDVLTAPF